MARTVKDYMDFLKNVKDAIPNQTEAIIKRNEKLILDLNRQSQLYEKGIDSKGFEINPEYRPFTIEIKQLIGQPYDHVTLFYSGRFYNSFFIKYNKDTFMLEILADDEKTRSLVTKYGSDIFGLTNENQKILNDEIVLPELLKYIKQYL